MNGHGDLEVISQPGIHSLEILKDELEVLATYRRAKTLKYADINISIQEGQRVKLWLTEKMK